MDVLRHEIATDNNFNVIKDQVVGPVAVGTVAAPKIKIGIPNLHLRCKGLDYTRFELFWLFLFGRVFSLKIYHLQRIVGVLA